MQKTLFLFLLLNLISHAWSAVDVAPVKILSINFNSENVLADKSQIIRDLRFAAIIDWVKKNDIDVILLQEAWNYRGDSSVATTIANHLGYDVSYRLGMGFPLILYDSDAVVAKKSMKLSKPNNIKLPHSAIEIGNGQTWIVETGRVSYAASARLELSNGDPLYVYSTHLIAKSGSDRRDQAKAIHQDFLSKIKIEGKSPDKVHAVIAGDFNSAPHEDGPKYLVDEGYVDSFDFAHPGDPSCTYCADPRLPYFNPKTIGADLYPSQADSLDSERFDYVFVKSSWLRPVASTMVFTSPLRGVWMSDHFASFVVLGGNGNHSFPNPSHDSDENLNPQTQIIHLTMDSFKQKHLPEIQVSGARGVTFINETNFSVKITFDTAPGRIDQAKVIKPTEGVAFSFMNEGKFNYQAKKHNLSEIFNPKKLSGSVDVVKSGFH